MVQGLLASRASVIGKESSRSGTPLRAVSWGARELVLDMR